MVDDLITRGVTEPYRMFTSRAEYRLSLREDNADARLTEIGYRLGIVDEVRWSAFCKKRDAVAAEIERLKSVWINPKLVSAETQQLVLGRSIEREYAMHDLLKRPEMNYDKLFDLVRAEDQGAVLADLQLAKQVTDQVEIEIKYAGYVARQKVDVDRQAALEQTKIPAGFDYSVISGLSHEVVNKLEAAAPETVGQASRISGVTPAAISLLLVYIKRFVATAKGK